MDHHRGHDGRRLWRPNDAGGRRWSGRDDERFVERAFLERHGTIALDGPVADLQVQAVDGGAWVLWQRDDGPNDPGPVRGLLVDAEGKPQGPETLLVADGLPRGFSASALGNRLLLTTLLADGSLRIDWIDEEGGLVSGTSHEPPAGVAIGPSFDTLVAPTQDGLIIATRDEADPPTVGGTSRILVERLVCATR